MRPWCACAASAAACPYLACWLVLETDKGRSVDLARLAEPHGGVERGRRPAALLEASPGFGIIGIAKLTPTTVGGDGELRLLQRDCAHRPPPSPPPTLPPPSPPKPPPTPPAPPTPPPAPPSVPHACLNVCTLAGDGDCDDGGPGAEFALCHYAEDCDDCGGRPPLTDAMLADGDWETPGYHGLRDAAMAVQATVAAAARRRQGRRRRRCRRRPRRARLLPQHCRADGRRRGLVRVGGPASCTACGASRRTPRASARTTSAGA